MGVILVGTITTVDSRQIIRRLEQNGCWVLRAVKGSHHVFTHPVKGGHVSVPHPRNDLGAGIVRQILKSAGLL